MTTAFTTTAPAITTPMTTAPTTTHPQASDRDDPHALNREWAQAFNRGDLDALMELYEPGAVLVPGPGAEPVRGHQAIRAALTWFLGLGGTLHFCPHVWVVNDDLALSGVGYRMEGGHDADGTPVPLAGTTAEIARRGADGRWRYVVDHPFAGG